MRIKYQVVGQRFEQHAGPLETRSGLRAECNFSAVCSRQTRDRSVGILKQTVCNPKAISKPFGLFWLWGLDLNQRPLGYEQAVQPLSAVESIA